MNEKELQDGLYHYLYLNNDEYRWCRNKKDRKRWFRKNKLTDEWEYVSFLGDYHTELMFYYCIYCGVKSARLCYSELSIRDSELGPELDDDKKRDDYDFQIMQKKNLLEHQSDVKTIDRNDFSLSYHWKCMNKCVIKNPEKDLYHYKKDMIKERVKRRMEIEHLNKYLKHIEKKEKEEKIMKENEDAWEKFI